MQVTCRSCGVSLERRHDFPGWSSETGEYRCEYRGPLHDPINATITLADMDLVSDGFVCQCGEPGQAGCHQRESCSD